MSIYQVKPKRLGNDNYVRPEKTYTDKLTKEQIKEQLEDYKRVEDISKVPTGVHVRYFSLVNGKKKYRSGGKIMSKDGLPNYILLTNNTQKWSVQAKDTVFFRQMTLKEIKKDFVDQLEEQDLVIKNQEKEINRLQTLLKQARK